MKLRYQLYKTQMIGGSIAIFLAFMFAASNFYQANIASLRQYTFERLYGNTHARVFLLFLVGMLLYHFFMNYRKYSIAKKRLLLLPQWRGNIVLADVILLFVMLFLLYGLSILVYAWKLQAFLALLEKHEIVNYAQTTNIWVSLHRSPMLAYLYPSDILGMVRVISMTFFLSSLSISLANIILLEKHPLQQQLCICIGICMIVGIVLVAFHDSMCILVCILSTFYMLKQTIRYWSENWIGG